MLPKTVGLLAALTAVPDAAAVQVEPPPRSELCARADLVLLAETTSVESAWADHPVRAIETTWDLHVERALRGELPDEGVRLVIGGGTVGGLTLTLSEEPELHGDHRYLLLLQRRADGRYVALGGLAGVVPLARGPDGPGETERAALTSLEGCLHD